jgi:hypothetical protein
MSDSGNPLHDAKKSVVVLLKAQLFSCLLSVRITFYGLVFMDLPILKLILKFDAYALVEDLAMIRFS